MVDYASLLMRAFREGKPPRPVSQLPRMPRPVKDDGVGHRRRERQVQYRQQVAYNSHYETPEAEAWVAANPMDVAELQAWARRIAVSAARLGYPAIAAHYDGIELSGPGWMKRLLEFAERDQWTLRHMGVKLDQNEMRLYQCLLVITYELDRMRYGL